LLKEIARGGMGVVYRARQVSLNRIVAVKMLLAGSQAKKDFVQRFRTESAAAASLQHPNIVAIHEVGFAEGQHFFAMDFVEGLTLAELAAKGPLPARQAATYLKTVAEAIHFAHERNVLHRDLKPSNVLIDSATDQPRITDFGLAQLKVVVAIESHLILSSPAWNPPAQRCDRTGADVARRDCVNRSSELAELVQKPILQYPFAPQCPGHSLLKIKMREFGFQGRPNPNHCSSLNSSIWACIPSPLKRSGRA